MEESPTLRDELGVEPFSDQAERDEFARLVELPEALVHRQCQTNIMSHGVDAKNAALEVLFDRALAI